MKRNYTFIPLLLLLIVAIVACSNNSSKSAADNDSEGDATKATVQVPQFSADSAYQYIQTQADFGPRVPNTAAHKAVKIFFFIRIRYVCLLICPRSYNASPEYANFSLNAP